MENNTTNGDPTQIFIDRVKEIRLEIDRTINTAKGLTVSSRETSLAFTNLQRGKMWLGKVLGAIGTANPYPDSTNPDNKKIEPQADHTPEGYLFDPSFGQIERVKALRKICDGSIANLEFLTFPASPTSPSRGDQFINQSLLAMEEAKMWYGWELDRIRNESEAKA